MIAKIGGNYLNLENIIMVKTNKYGSVVAMVSADETEPVWVFESQEEARAALDEAMEPFMKAKNRRAAMSESPFAVNGEYIENMFTRHAPKEDKLAVYEDLRGKAKELAYLIDSACPESSEKSLAFSKLEESIMWANAAIARHE